MRIALDFVVAVCAVAGVLGGFVRHRRRVTHRDYQRQLEEENRELDEQRRRLGL